MSSEVTGPSSGHIAVLLGETLALLNPKPGEIAVDCTVGRGGHSAAIATEIAPDGKVYGFDLDSDNLSHSAKVVSEAGGCFVPIQDSFVRMPLHLVNANVRADMVLADLGFSSTQMEDANRGFSFNLDGPLDMRYDPEGPTTAAQIVNTFSEEEIADLIFEFGEEPYARKIARKLVQTRKVQPIHTTAQLVQTVLEAYGKRAQTSRMHPATRTFMALRIAVNDEMAALQALMDQIIQSASKVNQGGWLNLDARIAVISFHSLEDRIVKRSFNELADRGLGALLTKRPVVATEAEVMANSRSRSAKLRAFMVGARA